MNQSMKNRVGIIGYGRFGKVLNELLKKEFEIKIYDEKIKKDPLELVLSANDIFIAVPIRDFEAVIKTLAPKIHKNTTVIDVCSVKLHPVRVMEKYLSATTGIIATHPLFGPDSIHEKNHLKIMMHDVRDTQGRYAFWKNFFFKKDFSIIEMTPDEHDRNAAQSQTLTHFIGRSLQKINAKSTPIDTLGFEKLLSVMAQTCNDSTELFEDMLTYNPYSAKTIAAFVEEVCSLGEPSEPRDYK